MPSSEKKQAIQPAKGKLGVMTVGMGAVATTLIAGVEAVRKGLAKPIGSVTQMGTIRLGKRTDNRTPLIKDFVPLADLNDIVFTGWEIFPENMYEAAAHAAVLDRDHLQSIKPFLEAIQPMPAVFDQYYVKRLNGTHVKTGKSKCDLAQQLRSDIQKFRSQVDRVVVLWCGSTEIFMEPAACHQSLAAFEKASPTTIPPSPPRRSTPTPRSKKACPSPTAPQPDRRPARLIELARQTGAPICGKDFKTGQTLIKTVLAPAFKARMWESPAGTPPTSSATATARSSTTPSPSRPRRNRSSACSSTSSSPRSVPRALRRHLPQGPDQLLPAPRRQQRRLGQHRHLRLARLPDADQGQLPLPRLHPRRALRPRPGPVHGPRQTHARTQSPRHPGVAQLLSSRAPKAPPGLYPEHDLFIQSMKLKNTLRHIMGEDLITHLGLEYYD